MIGELLEFIVSGILSNINLVFFLSMLLVPEFIKEFTYYNERKRIRWFRIDKKARFKFRMKRLIFLLGLIIGFVFWYFNILLPEDSTLAITQLIFTYIIITTMYDLLFHAIIKKFRDVLKTVGNAKIKPMEISLVDDFDNNLDGYWYGDSSSKTEELTEDDVVNAYDNQKRELQKYNTLDEIPEKETPEINRTAQRGFY